MEVGAKHTHRYRYNCYFQNLDQSVSRLRNEKGANAILIESECFTEVSVSRIELANFFRTWPDRILSFVDHIASAATTQPCGGSSDSSIIRWHINKWAWLFLSFFLCF